nr:GNAT family N-acetyltransferase [Ligilactobacillus ruminis]
MHIFQIANDEDKKSITRNILEELPEWFGIPEAREEYIRDSEGKVFFCAMENEKDLGFLYLKETGKDTVELAVMGVLKEYHHKGIGKELFNRAKRLQKKWVIHLYRLKLFKWGNINSMTIQIVFTFLLVLRSLKYFLHYGINGIPAKSM